MINMLCFTTGVNKLATIGSNNGLSPDQHRAFIWTNAGLLLIGPLGKNFSEISIKSDTYSCKKMHLIKKMAAILSRPQCVKFYNI